MATMPVAFSPVGTADAEESQPPAAEHVQLDASSAEPAPLPMPHHVRLGFLADARFRILLPFEVHLISEHESTVAEAVEVDEFGYGGNSAEAIRDLQRTLVELYESLDHDQARLGPDLDRVWRVLQEKLARRR